MLKEHKEVIGWLITDLKGIDPSICMHYIHCEADAKLYRDMQHRLNPIIWEVVKKEIIKWLDVGIIYPIFDSKWITLTQVVQKKSCITVVDNEKGELLPTRAATGWRVCVDYRRLNVMTRNDHFLLPFIDQILKRLAGQGYFYFLDGYLRYNQMLVFSEDQDKTIFTYPYSTFAFRRMPFGPCNASVTFQWCIMAIFSDIVDKFLEDFMGDFSIFGPTFDDCLPNLTKVLKRCVEMNLVLS